MSRSFKRFLSFLRKKKKNWCRGPDSNRHRCYTRRILSPLRLPIPPPRHQLIFLVEAAPGIEPGIKVLQTRALPLGYAAFNLLMHKYNSCSNLAIYPFLISNLLRLQCSQRLHHQTFHFLLLNNPFYMALLLGNL